MRARVIFAVLIVLAIEGLGLSLLMAQDGTIKVRINEAVAFKKNNDDVFDPQQDFYAINSIDGGPPSLTPEIGGRDDARWSNQIDLKQVPGRNQRFFDFYFELWDRDTCCLGNVDDGFDISPQNGPSFRRTLLLDDFDKTGRFGIPLDDESITVEGRRCDVSLRVLDIDRRLQQLRVRLEVKAPEGSTDRADTRAVFDVGYFDFPMIDNTRLADGLRCAVTLSAFTPESADLTTICFPGDYASLKDRPYYDEVIQRLQRSAEADREEALHD